MEKENTTPNEHQQEGNTPAVMLSIYDKYYHKTNHSNFRIPIENCQYLNNGTKIGSVWCQKCTHCISSADPDINGHVHWIKCEYINEATGRKY